MWIGLLAVALVYDLGDALRSPPAAPAEIARPPMTTRVTRMLGLRHPIVQAGMSWASSNTALPAAVSKAGALGVIAAGPLRFDDLKAIVAEVKAAVAGAPFAVNVPLTSAGVEAKLDFLHGEGVPVIIASQGAPQGRHERFQAKGTRWFHVVASVEHARKAAAASVDGLVVVGAEAGGHPPPSEVGTIVIVRRVVQEIPLPVIAGGGVADGHGIAALLALGADAVQLGTRFLLTHEANVHPAYKDAVLATPVEGTTLVGRRDRPIRALKNRFSEAVEQAERGNVPEAEYKALIASSSLKRAALEGDVGWGKVEAGQSAGLVSEILPAAEVVSRLAAELEAARQRLLAMDDATA